MKYRKPKKDSDFFTMLDHQREILVRALGAVLVGVEGKVAHGEVAGRRRQSGTHRAVTGARDAMAGGAVGIEDDRACCGIGGPGAAGCRHEGVLLMA